MYLHVVAAVVALVDVDVDVAAVAGAGLQAEAAAGLGAADCWALAAQMAALSPELVLNIRMTFIHSLIL